LSDDRAPERLRDPRHASRERRGHTAPGDPRGNSKTPEPSEGPPGSVSYGHRGERHAGGLRGVPGPLHSGGRGPPESKGYRGDGYRLLARPRRRPRKALTGAPSRKGFPAARSLAGRSHSIAGAPER